MPYLLQNAHASTHVTCCTKKKTARDSLIRNSALHPGNIARVIAGWLVSVLIGITWEKLVLAEKLGSFAEGGPRMWPEWLRLNSASDTVADLHPVLCPVVCPILRPVVYPILPLVYPILCPILHPMFVSEGVSGARPILRPIL